MTKPLVAVIDYGMGNLRSVINALTFLGAEADLVSTPEKLSEYPYMILPGVGSFRRAMESIRDRNLDAAITTAASSKRTKILGICLGMQLLGSNSDEDGFCSGLGLIDIAVRRFSTSEMGGRKIPHVGFNSISYDCHTSFFANLPTQPDFYFVHSYRMLPNNTLQKYATCTYGTQFLAAFERDNIFGTQFHPEKSQTNGLIMLKNFLGRA